MSFAIAATVTTVADNIQSSNYHNNIIWLHRPPITVLILLRTLAAHIIILRCYIFV